MADIGSGSYAHAIVKSYDEATESLKTTIVNAAVEVNVSAFTDSIKIGDASGVTATITTIAAKKGLDVNVIDIALDAANDSVSVPGVATAANQVIAQNSLTSIDAKQDYSNFESNHQTISASTDTTITFSQAVRMVRVTNWDIVNIVLVKNGSISTNSDSTASRVGIAPALNIPNSEIFPITTSSIHIRSAGSSEVTVEGFR